MKKFIILLLAISFFVVCTGCGSSKVSVDSDDFVSNDSTIVSETIGIISSSVSIINESSTVGTEINSRETTTVSSQKSVDSTSKSTNSPQNNNPNSQNSNPPVISQPSTVSTQKLTEPTIPQTKTTTTTKQPAFNVQHYVDYAKQYGISIGLTYEPEIGDWNWNAPLHLNSTLSDEQMKINIRSHCNRLVREDCEFFWLYLEKQKDENFLLYVYYG